MTNVIKIIQSISNALRTIKQDQGCYTNGGFNVFCARQWFDFREQGPPSLSVFILEESLLDTKGASYKQSLNGKVEGHIQQGRPEEIYYLAADIKQALLTTNFPFQFQYLGYEITPPDEGSNISSVQVRFTVTYIEEIRQGDKHARL